MQFLVFFAQETVEQVDIPPYNIYLVYVRGGKNPLVGVLMKSAHDGNPHIANQYSGI